MIAHVPGSESTIDRERGFEDVIKTDYPGITLVARQFGMSDRAKARAVTENILTAHPDLDGIFASAEPSSIGAALALKSLKRAGKVKFVAFDSSDTLVADLRSGVIDALVVQDPYGMGFESVKILVNKLNGKTPPSRIDLEARVVTKADLNSKEVQHLLNPAAQ